MTYLYIRVDFASGASLGPSRAAILEGIEQHGALAASSRAVVLTYRQVWSTVQVMNARFPDALVATRASGPKGRASLTPLGRKLLARYRPLERDAAVQLQSHTRAMQRMIEEDTKSVAPTPHWAQVLGPSATTNGSAKTR
jgi:molybdate transport system regulatory protein